VCKGCVLADVVVPSAAPIVKHMQPTVQKNDAELPKLTPPHSPQYYYKKNTNSGLIRIQQELTTKKK